MADTFDILDQRQIAAAAAAHYTVAAAKQAALVHITLVQTVAASIDVDIYINGAVEANRWRRVTLSAQYEAWEWEGKLLLGVGDAIQMKATRATEVTATISGVVSDV